MGLGLLLPLLLLWTQGTQGSKLDPNGQHVCVASRWVSWECDPLC
ncbi:SCARF1 isoform 6 [Pongo abelii]|uniref:SCARF1 isoform 6 n=1 Tax=Pongo abelii TaxID=9601 RepID=A0A2J8SNX2_PONAB|nr:SCARF1 isoform 6 [Pongo abelii]